MRTLERNKTKLWYVAPATKVETQDEDGFLTGEFQTTFGAPVVVYLALYPASGRVGEQIFGKDHSLDLLAVTDSVVLEKDGLLFRTEPVSNYEATFSFKVSAIKKSLDVIQYGLKGRA